MRIFLWALGALIILFIVGTIAVQVAIARNGPAVLDSVDRLTGGARGVTLLGRLSTGDHPAQKVILWGPEGRDANAEPLPILLFAHGGSWRTGDPEDYAFVARAFVPEGFVVALSGYRLVKEGAPDGVYPAMLEDTAEAIVQVRKAAAQYGADPDRIVVMGHSAGAYNVVTATLQREWLAERGDDADSLKGAIGLSGPYDFYPFTSDSTIAAFGAADDPEATQTFNHVRGDAAPILLIHGEKDTVVRPRNSRELAKLIETAGGDVAVKLYPDMEHNDPLMAFASPWRLRSDVVEVISAFAKDATDR